MGTLKLTNFLLLLIFADWTASAESGCNMGVVHGYGDDVKKEGMVPVAETGYGRVEVAT